MSVRTLGRLTISCTHWHAHADEGIVALEGANLHDPMGARAKAGATMRLVRSLIEHLQRWIARYKAALDYVDARDGRGLTSEIEWNGRMVGDLRRRSLDT
jgi:hypothetical protein